MLGVPGPSRDGRDALVGEGTLFWQLHTVPLPAPRVPVGYLRWNAGFLYALALEQSLGRPRVALLSGSSRQFSLFARSAHNFPDTWP